MKKSFNKILSFFISFLMIVSVLKPVGNVYAWSAADPAISVSVLPNPSSNINFPLQMALDQSGNLYFSNGSTLSNPGISKYDSNDNYVLALGSQANSPTGVAVTNDGKILVIDWQENDVELYNPDGTLYKFLKPGGGVVDTDPGPSEQFVNPYAAAVDSTGKIYIAETDVGGGGTSRVSIYGPAPTYSYIGQLTANGPTPFGFVESIAIDPSDNLYVMDSDNNRVQKFNVSGTFQYEITGHGSSWIYPQGLGVDSSGNLYVPDSGNDRIQIFDSSGTFQQEIVDAGSQGAFDYITGIAVRDDGRMYVGDNTRILVFHFDRTPATVTVDPLPSNTTNDPTTTITGTATDDLTNISGVEYSVDSGSYNPCTADDGAFDELSETFTCTISPALTDGSHTIDVRATDGSANTNSGANLTNYDFSVDTTTPAPTPTNSPTPTPTPTSSNSNSNSSNSAASPGNPKAPTCNASKPDAPDLFQIDAADTGVKIFYTPQSSGVSDYYISYGKNIEDLEYGTFTGYGASSGVLSFNIGYLSPNTRYYFKVRGQNGCMPGNWSNIIAATTNGSTYYKNSLQAVISTAANSVSNAKSFIGNLPSLISPTAPPIRENPLPTNTGSGKNELPVSPPAPAKKCFLWIFCF